MFVNGYVLKMLRVKRGLSQRDVAEKAQVSQSLICRVETGDLPLTDSARARLVRALEITEADERFIQVLLEGGDR